MTKPASNRIKFIVAYTDQSRLPGGKLRESTSQAKPPISIRDSSHKDGRLRTPP